MIKYALSCLALAIVLGMFILLLPGPIPAASKKNKRVDVGDGGSKFGKRTVSAPGNAIYRDKRPGDANRLSAALPPWEGVDRGIAANKPAEARENRGGTEKKKSETALSNRMDNDASSMAPPGGGIAGFPVAVVAFSRSPAHISSPFPALASPSASGPSASGPSASSASALGSLAPWDYFPGAAQAPEKPGLGLRTWTAASFHHERAKPAGADRHGHYRQRGSAWQLGLDYDFTLNSVLRASLEISRQRVESIYPGDDRKSDLNVRTVGLGGDWLLGERTLLSGKAFYGWAGSRSSGAVSLRRYDAIGGTYYEERADWRESGGDSVFYGFSAKATWPISCGQSVKILPEIGLEFVRVRSPARSVELFANGFLLRRMDMPRQSYYLNIPSTVRTRRDYLNGWGLLSPHLDLGLVLELGKSKNAAKTFNAGSAWALESKDFGLPSNLRNDSSARIGVLFGLGLDAAWNNGWEVRANLNVKWNSGQYRNDLRLEAGKCF